MMKAANRVFLVLALALLAVFCAKPVHAQGNATLTGTVTDPSNAVVPDVSITVTHVSTNVSYNTKTTGAGLYRFPLLPIGGYVLNVKPTGFRAVRIANIVLTVGQTVVEDVKLEVGAITETITVEGGGVQLVTPTESKVAGLIDSNTISKLPLEVREPSAFVNLMPGVVSGETISSAIGTASRGPSVHGSRSGTGNFLVDGFDNNDQGQGGRGGSGSSLGAPGAQVGISPEALAEFRVVTSNFEAEHGRAGGFVVQVGLKSGTNDLHGSLFEYNRVQKLAANSWASNKAGIKDTLVRNQFGGSIGGPIKKDKTFWFSSVEFHRMRTSGPTSVTSVTPDFISFVQSGAFANFMESSSDGICNNQAFWDTLVDVEGANPRAAAPCPGTFSNSSNLGSLFNELNSGFGLPVPSDNFTNEAGGWITGYGLTYPVNVYGTAYASDSSYTNQGRFSLKFDHNISDRHRLAFTFLFDDLDQGGDFGGDVFNPAFPWTNPGRNQIYGLTYSSTLTPTVVNEARFGYLRDRGDFPSLLDPEPPSIYTWDALTTGFGRSASLPQYFTNNQFQIADNLSWIKGKHTFKFGGEYRRTRNGSAFEALKNGDFEPYDVENLLTDGAFGDELDQIMFGGPVYGGIAWLGASINPETSGYPEYYRGFRANELGIYAQDNWRIHSDLTLNLGIRWEYQGPPHNFRKGIDSNFYFGGTTMPANWTSGTNPLCDASGNPQGNPYFPCGSDGFRMVANGSFLLRDNEIWAKDKNNFAPRVGFAWDVGGKQKLVLRWGGGVFYDRIWNNLFENIRFNLPLYANASIGWGGDGTPVGPLSFPGLYDFPFDRSVITFFPPVSPRHMDENLVLPYTQQYFFGVQYQLADNYALHVNYTSTLGRKLTGLVDLNTYPGRSSPGFRSTRPNTAIGSDNSRNNAFKSNYHGLEVQLIKRMSRGLQFQANYTFSKAIDEMSDAFSGKDSLRPTNMLNIALDRGRADFDIPHQFTSSLFWEIPLAKNNRWAGGWTTGGIVSIRQGTPFSLVGTADRNRDGYANDRAAYLGNTPAPIGMFINHNVSPADGYLTTRTPSGAPLFGNTPFDPSVNNGRWIDGQLGRNILTGPGYTDVTWTIQKRFRVTENTAFSFQGNFFNMFNHPNFTRPSQLVTSGSFGKSTNTFDSRIVQLALRFDF